MSKRYSGKSFKDSSLMKKAKLTLKEKSIIVIKELRYLENISRMAESLGGIIIF